MESLSKKEVQVTEAGREVPLEAGLAVIATNFLKLRCQTTRSLPENGPQTLLIDTRAFSLYDKMLSLDSCPRSQLMQPDPVFFPEMARNRILQIGFFFFSFSPSKEHIQCCAEEIGVLTAYRMEARNVVRA